MRAVTHLTDLLVRVLADMGQALPERAAVEPPKDASFGDLATNVAMLLTKEAKRPPRELAQDIAARLAADADVAKADIAGPGFINVTFTPSFWQRTVAEVLEQGARYGTVDLGKGQKFQVEYVSANPTGPLHIGHGRGAAVGDSLSRILTAAGWNVSREYYINDAGRQMKILGESIFVRYRQLKGEDIPFLEDGYKGDYIKDHAQELIDAENRGEYPGGVTLAVCQKYGETTIMDGIRKDLADFNVGHDVWFSEQSLLDAGAVDKAFERLKASGLAFEKDGAFWFRTTELGDDKDRVLRKSTGELTYFASDIAYHADKYDRGFERVVDIWGADHHGYVPRMKAAIQALGIAAERFDVILVQLVNLLRNGEQVAMSTRAGTFETLADVVKEVGADSARFIFLSRKADSKLDFDLELVKQQSMDNPVYYVQYAHARIASVERKAAEAGIAMPKAGAADLSLLDTAEDALLLKQLERFPDTVETAARTLSPHHVSYYVRELAGLLHRYYTVNPVLNADNPGLTGARLVLLTAVKQVLAAGLQLLGVSAPERM